MANLDSQENRPLIESDPLRGGKRLKVAIEGQSLGTISTVNTLQ